MSEVRSTEVQLTAAEAMARIREAVNESGIAYQCCFCHETIEGDVHALVLITKWNGPEDKQRDQQWFCHAECFTKATGEHIDVLKDGA